MLTGALWNWRTGPSLQLFEHPGTEAEAEKVLIIIGGLTDGLLPCRYAHLEVFTNYSLTKGFNRVISPAHGRQHGCKVSHGLANGVLTIHERPRMCKLDTCRL